MGVLGRTNEWMDGSMNMDMRRFDGWWMDWLGGIIGAMDMDGWRRGWLQVGREGEGGREREREREQRQRNNRLDGSLVYLNLQAAQGYSTQARGGLAGLAEKEDGAEGEQKEWE